MSFHATSRALAVSTLLFQGSALSAQCNKPVIPASGLPTATVVDTPLTTLDSLGRGDATFKLTTYSPGPSALVANG